MKRVFLTYGNSKSQPEIKGADKILKHLKEEYRAVKKVLKPLANRNLIQLDSDQFLYDKKDLTEALSEADKKDLILFSYSGHAVYTRMKYENQIIRWEALAEWLSPTYFPKLKLVFLNGCLTEGALFHFEDKAIPIVICTNTKIDDAMAKEFAIAFYTELAADRTIERAYRYALTQVKFEHPVKSIIRCQTKTISENALHVDAPWTLNVQNRSFLNWRLISGIVNNDDFSHDIEQLKNWRSRFLKGNIHRLHCNPFRSYLDSLNDDMSMRQLGFMFAAPVIRVIKSLLKTVNYFQQISSLGKQETQDTRTQIVDDINSIINYLS